MQALLKTPTQKATEFKTRGIEPPDLIQGSSLSVKDQWKSMSYADFADRLYLKFPKVMFSKQKVDDAFIVAASRYTSSKREPRLFEDVKQGVSPEASRPC